MKNKTLDNQYTGQYFGPKNRDELISLLFLLINTNLVFRWGIQIFRLLASPTDLFTMNSVDLKELGISDKDIIKITKPNWQSVEDHLTWMSQEGQHIITINDCTYPKLLREIPNPPALLFVMGSLDLLRNNQIAVVGSRTPTPQGLKISWDFARGLSDRGITITSGAAIGIDSASHRGAMDSLGKTIAVLGSGLNHIYPVNNQSLITEILDRGGAAVSEFPLNRCAATWHFPVRNRIISGLSFGTLVVEAALKSGSLITARLAGEQGREVFAIPGSICNQKSSGTNYLIKQGAKLVNSLEDILEEFAQLSLSETKVHTTLPITSRKNKLDSFQEKLLDCITSEGKSIEELAIDSSLPVAQISQLLVELELMGEIKEWMDNYVRAE